MILQRKYAKEACLEGFVYINGRKVKPSAKVKEGDIVEINLPIKYVKFKVLSLPPKNVKKNEIEKYIEIIEFKKKDIREILFKETENS